MELTLSGGTKVPVKRKGFGDYSSNDFSIKDFGKNTNRRRAFSCNDLRKRSLYAIVCV